MKKRLYLILFLSFIFVVCTSLYVGKNIYNDFKIKFSKKYYEETIREYKSFINQERLFLFSTAQYLADSNKTLRAYLKNKPQILLKEYMPLYKTFYKNHIIDSLHFFKTPLKNFLSFSNPGLKEINLSNREDILWVNTSFKPSVYFFIGRHFPELRATYPIIYNYHIYGSVSLGSNIIKLKKMFENLNFSASVYINDKLLKKSLKKNYFLYKKYPLYQNYRVIGDVYKIKFNDKYKIKENYVYIIIPVKDIFKHKMAYIVVKRSFVDVLHIIRKNVFKKIIFEIFIYIFVFGMSFILLRYIYLRFNELQNILEIIKEKNFDRLPEKVKAKDEFDVFKNNLIDMAKNLSVYINILTNEMKYYSKKAYIDDLTSIYNRNFLEEKAGEITMKFKLSKEPLGVIMFDIDDFKKINDTYGHDIGDLVLSELARNIKNMLRKEDIFIRYGGEEFVIFLPNTLFKDAVKIAQKIKTTVENLKIQTPEKTLHITVSIGVSEFSLKDDSIFETIKRADEKLYKAKRSGKNRVVY